MRYSVRNATVNQVKQVGGSNVKETRVAVFADLTPQQLEKLKNLGAVVESVKEVQSAVIIPVPAPPLPVAGVPTWSPATLIYATGINQIREMTRPQLYGEGFNVAVIGTGIRDTHEQVGGRVVYKKNYTSDPHADAFDHETGVAAIIVTVVPLCNILDMKALDSKGQGTSEQVVLAIDDLISGLPPQNDTRYNIVKGEYVDAKERVQPGANNPQTPGGGSAAQSGKHYRNNLQEGGRE